jgi:hypothetical protein
LKKIELTSLNWLQQGMGLIGLTELSSPYLGSLASLYLLRNSFAD